jgi:hypothetical protein
MQADLQKLLFSKGELRRLTGLDSWRYPWVIYFVILLTILDLPSKEQPGELKASIQAFGEARKGWILEFFIYFCLAIIELIGITKNIKKYQRKPLISLLMDIKNHNNLIYQIYVLDQLRSVGNQVDLEDRKTILEALAITRDNLVRSLQTEKILRENPGFRPESFTVNLTSIKSLEVNETSSEYGKLLNSALQIAISVQTEIQAGLFEPK